MEEEDLRLNSEDEACLIEEARLEANQEDQASLKAEEESIIV